MLLQKRLRSKGAVLVEGAKWCGKTTTSMQIAKSILYMQDPATVRLNLELADINPGRLLKGETPRLIDEWQMAPKLWDAVRFEVDRRDEFGQFILTGSAVPADMSQIFHSGTGRISRILMRPMTLFESGESSGEVSLGELFRNGEDRSGTDTSDISGECDMDIEYLAYIICRGGWPRAVCCNPETEKDIALQQALDYCDAVASSDISRADNVDRNPERVRRLMRSYARGIGSQTKMTSIVADMSANDVDPLSIITVKSYISALKKIFVIEDSPSWNPNLRSKTAIRTSDTRYYTDPSIGTAALGLGPGDLVNDPETMGFFFENLCIRDLRVYAEANDGSVYHYRDKSGLECDAVVHLRNGSYGLIEIKLGGDRLVEEGAETLKRLEKSIDTGKMKLPSFKMVLTGIGPYAYRRKDGILVVPVGCLKN